ncbi:hypothetical protein M0638_07870 [Roseomonas sp. NAR14]|uniref:Uncharacterized protein n=1 Tax=Roseomonas acroporae TaxID=2937791 RepID=A0A9X1Y6B2_9PROT|nr:hypothetical protein [Roseomonas acroporae]MCK8784293.1 hypothetical protein [Roseomonas acroporae]
MKGPFRAVMPALLAGMLVAVLALGVAAQEGRPARTPDATLEIEQLRVGLLAAGASLGGGRLHFQDREYPFTVQGIEFTGAGIATLSVRGDVFGLARIEDFPGRYRPEPAEAGESPTRSSQWLFRNDHGVEVRLRSERSSGSLRISDTGLLVELR